MPRPSPPSWAPKRLAPPSRQQRSSSFPRSTRSHAHRCSRLTRQHGGEQSGLVNVKVVSESRVTYLCANFGLPRPLCSRFRQARCTGQSSSDRRQTASSLNAPPNGRGLNKTIVNPIEHISQICLACAAVSTAVSANDLVPERKECGERGRCPTCITASSFPHLTI